MGMTHLSCNLTVSAFRVASEDAEHEFQECAQLFAHRHKDLEVLLEAVRSYAELTDPVEQARQERYTLLEKYTELMSALSLFHCAFFFIGRVSMVLVRTQRGVGMSADPVAPHLEHRG